MFEAFLSAQKDKINQENLNLDGTQSLVKKYAESVGYQVRKKGKTSNVLIITDGNGIPIGIGDIISGNHNDLYQVVPQFRKMIKDIKRSGINVENSFLNADKGFDSKKLRIECSKNKMFPNINENTRNRKKYKRGRKRFFMEKVYKNRMVIERSFAWLDSFRTLQTRYDTLDKSWLNWHYLAFVLILLKV